MIRSAVIFPGQGAQIVGMGRDVADGCASARALYDRTGAILDFDLSGYCFDGPVDALARTDIQQPAIFVTSAALWTALGEAARTVDQFHWAGGLSLGEYTALYVAGALAFDDAVHLVHRRGQLMQEAALAAPSGMVSVIGGDEETARSLCESAREGDVLVAANFNCPGQIVLSGGKAACERAVRMAPDYGLRAVALAVAGAFHSPLMQSAADGLRSILQETNISTPAISVVSNVNAQPHETAVDIRAALCAQVTQPVLWQKCIERMVADGVERFVEIGPGRVLTGLMRKIDRSIAVTNVSTMQDVQEFLATVAI